jgi:uncharacterized protein
MSTVSSGIPASPERSGGAARVCWPAVATYYALACLISWPIFWWRDIHPQAWAAFSAPGFVKAWLPALGPFLAAVAAFCLFPRVRGFGVRLWGSSLWRSLLFAAAPLAIYTALGRGDDQPHLTALLVGLIYLVYALGEETGWRGFLQGALTPVAPRFRYPLIGLAWGVWHFTTFTRGELHQVVPRLALMLALWILGSWGIGKALESTGSLLVCAVLHLVFNFSTAMPPPVAAAVLGGSAAVWIVLLRAWPPLEAPAVPAEAPAL